MKKDAIELTITVVLIVVLIFVVVNIFKGKSGKKPKEIVTTLNMQAPQEKPKTAPKADTIDKLKARADSLDWTKDPFVYRPAAAGTVVTLRLEGIVWDEVSPKAIISNNIVGVGDKIGESTIVEIRKEAVVLNDGEKIFELKLEE